MPQILKSVCLTKVPIGILKNSRLTYKINRNIVSIHISYNVLRLKLIKVGIIIIFTVFQFLFKVILPLMGTCNLRNTSSKERTVSSNRLLKSVDDNVH